MDALSELAQLRACFGELALDRAERLSIVRIRLAGAGKERLDPLEPSFRTRSQLLLEPAALCIGCLHDPPARRTQLRGARARFGLKTGVRQSKAGRRRRPPRRAGRQ